MPVLDVINISKVLLLFVKLQWDIFQDLNTFLVPSTVRRSFLNLSSVPSQSCAHFKHFLKNGKPFHNYQFQSENLKRNSSTFIFLENYIFLLIFSFHNHSSNYTQIQIEIPFSYFRSYKSFLSIEPLKYPNFFDACNKIYLTEGIWHE